MTSLVVNLLDLPPARRSVNEFSPITIFGHFKNYKRAHHARFRHMPASVPSTARP